MDLKTAKAWRTASKSAFTRKRKGLVDAVTGDGDSDRLVELEKELREAYAKLDKAHETVQIAREPQSDDEAESAAVEAEDLYIEAEYKLYNETLDILANHKRTKSYEKAQEKAQLEQNDRENLKTTKKAKLFATMTQCCDDMNRRADTVEEFVTKGDPLAVVEPFIKIAKQACFQYKEAQREYASVLDAAAQVGETKRYENSLKDYEKKLELGIIYVGVEQDKLSKEKEEHRKLVELEKAKHAPVVTADPTGAGGAMPEGGAVGGVRLERAKPPSFDGKYRSYPEWKKRFEAIVVPSTNPTRVCDAIRESIPEKYRHILRNIAYDDFKGMFNALDAKFKVPSLLVDAISQDIEKLSIPKDDKAMIHFIEVVEQAEADLKGEGMETEIHNTTVCGRIEARMPEEWRDEWIKVMFDASHPVNAANKFPDLLKFLGNLKKQLEYRASEVRKNKPPVKPEKTTRGMHGEVKAESITKEGCGQKCEKKHQLAWCPKFKKIPVTKRKNVVIEAKLCFRCLEPGHRLEDCTKDWNCKNCTKSNHHYLLCFKKREDKGEKPTKDADSHVGRSQKNISRKQNGKEEQPVVFQTQYVECVGGTKLGLIHDGCSDTNYITAEAAKKLKLKGIPWKLNMKGIGKLGTVLETFAAFFV